MAVMSESALSPASLLDDGAASHDVGPWVASAVPGLRQDGQRPSGWATTVAWDFARSARGAPPVSAGPATRSVIFDGQLHNADDLAQALAAPAGTSAADLVALAHDHGGAMRRSSASRAPSLCAIWMATTRTLKLVRDPVGTYPFFFAESAGRIAFGVDAEPLLSLPWVSRALNRAASPTIYRTAGCCGTRRTIRTCSGCLQALSSPGRAALADSNDIGIRLTLPATSTGFDEDAPDQFQEVFEQAIDRCLGQGRRRFS